jgi:MFS-type transporter involved in bile tolerance (Atg22 family)
VVVLAAITNASYGTTLYAFSVLLGEDAAAGEFGRALLSGALGLGVVVSGVLAPVVGTLCDVVGSRRVFFAGAVLGSAGLAAFSRATEGWQVFAAWALLVGPAMACTMGRERQTPGRATLPCPFGRGCFRRATSRVLRAAYLYLAPLAA